jgi:aspartate carbamoyltransferase regulatory subunit
MNAEQIKSIKMGSILTWIPTGEQFRVTGFNYGKIKDGTETKVTGMECDSDGRYTSESMSSVYSLINVKI